MRRSDLMAARLAVYNSRVAAYVSLPPAERALVTRPTPPTPTQADVDAVGNLATVIDFAAEFDTAVTACKGQIGA